MSRFINPNMLDSIQVHAVIYLSKNLVKLTGDSFSISQALFILLLVMTNRHRVL